MSEGKNSGTDNTADETENFRLNPAPIEWLKNKVETGIIEVVTSPP